MATPIPYKAKNVGNKAVQIQSGSGTIYSYSVVNDNSHAIYVKFYDKLAANVNPAVDAPAYSVTVAANSVANNPDSSSFVFSTAISVRCVTGALNENTNSPSISPTVEVDLAGGSGGGITSPLTIDLDAAGHTISNAVLSGASGYDASALNGLLTRAQTDFTPSTLAEAASLVVPRGTIQQVAMDGTHAPYTVSFSGSASSAKPSTILRLVVTNGPFVITIPTSYRIGDSGSTTTLALPTGNHEIAWLYDGTHDVMLDSSFEISITPTNLSGNVNNYSPTNLAYANTLRIDLGGASRTITGLDSTGSADGTRKRIVVIGSTGGSGSDTLTLSNASGSSSAANQFQMSADTILVQNQSLEFIYDATSTKWRPANRALSNTGVTAAQYGDSTHVAQITVGADGRVSAAAAVAISNGISIVGATWDGGGSALSTGAAKGYVTVPYAGTISGWSISADTGTATVKVWKVAAGTAVPTSGNNINTSGVALSSGTHVRSTTVTDFTSTAVTAGDILAFNLSAVSGATQLTFELEITR